MNAHRASFFSAIGCAVFLGGNLFGATAGGAVTFSKDIAPLMEKHCQECHRPGEAGPFSLLDYQQARPWAKAIKQAVLARKMPPWFADPKYGKFSNDRSMTSAEINTIVAWVNAGAPEGDPRDLPPPVQFTEGWSIPTPDVVLQLPRTYIIPASGTIEYQKVLLPAPFKEDKWVQFAEARPGDRAHVHHMIAYVREPGSHWLEGAKPGEFFVAPKPKDDDTDTSALPSDFLVGYAPGQPPEKCLPGQGQTDQGGFGHRLWKFIIRPNGNRVDGPNKVGLVFAKQPPKERVLTCRR